MPFPNEHAARLADPEKRSRCIGVINQRAALERYEPVVVHVRGIYANRPCASARHVARELNEMGVPGPTGGPWHPFGIYPDDPGVAGRRHYRLTGGTLAGNEKSPVS